MPRQVTYIELRIDSVEGYWRELIVPNVEECVRGQTPRTVFNAAVALWHLIDWVWHEEHPDEDTRNNPIYDTYRKQLLSKCLELAWLGDIADAGKHRGLGRKTVSTGLLPLPDAEGGMAIFVMEHYNPMERDFGTAVNIREVLDTVIQFWRAKLVDKDLPSPF